MAFQTISYELRGPVAVITLQRPDSQNAITRRMSGEIARACQMIEGDVRALVVVIAGAGGWFSSGWDTADLQEGLDRCELLDGSGIAAISELSKPVIAAVAGAAVGAGLELALAADLRIASEDARFASPECGWGLLPVAGGIQRLVRVVGRAAALEMLMTGDAFGVERALNSGLVSRVVAPDRLIAEALAVAERIAARGPLAVRYAKEAVYHGTEMALDDALRFETDLTVILQTTNDRAEGVRAFVEKRQPRFTGR